ncbi:FCD domain-containing protein [Agrobacterium sp. CG674]
MIARLAAKRCGQNDIQAIERTIDHMRFATMNVSADELIELNETFHDHIHAVSQPIPRWNDRASKVS